MANLTLTGGKGYFTWEISGLSWAFDTDHYTYAGICTKSFTNGAIYMPSGIVDMVMADQPGATTLTSVENSITYAAGTYTFYGFTQTPDGAWWNAGSATVTIKSSTTVSQWSWSKSNGSATALQTATAYDILQGAKPVSDGFSHLVWNDLVDKVDLMRTAKGLSWDTNYSGVTYLPKNQCYVKANSTLSADIYNSVRFQIGSVKGTGITDRTSGEQILGYYIIHMVDILNEIIQGL